MGIKLKIKKGTTFRKHMRWECEPYIYKPITAIQNSAPCTLHVPAHGLLVDQLFVIQAAQGLVELNAREPHEATDWYRATVVDIDHIQINRVNSLLHKKHTPSTGVIKYRSVVDLTGYTARMMIRERIDGGILFTLTTANGGLVLDPVTQFVEIIIEEDDTKTFTWTKGTYDLELVSSGGVVTRIVEGDVLVSKENTTI